MTGYAMKWDENELGTESGAGTARGGRRLCRMRRARWTGFEIAAMVVGFVLFWPVGLAILFYILWKKSRGQAVEVPQWAQIGPLARSTGNSAFEDWKSGELERLEEERRKLATAQAEFESFLSQLKRAKDREEFDRFLAERKKPEAA
jgi:hypothetical protein